MDTSASLVHRRHHGVLPVVLVLAVQQTPAAVVPLHHAPVPRHPPRRRHPVLLLECVVRLVHQRHVPLHHVLEPLSGGRRRARHPVQVAFQVVPHVHVAGRLEVRRRAGVDDQLDTHVMVRQRRVPGHDVPGVEDAQDTEAGGRRGVQPLLEAGAAHAWTGERKRRDRERRRGRAVVAVLGDVEGAQGGQRRPEAVPGHRDAHLLVLVRAHQLPHLSQRLT
uniref:Uncharacterized protein n=1 Tax=Triticum urartu TaxID=4572 RepID=A0A8R7QM18_TRIUA